MDTRPDWDTYFLNIALDVSKRATCLRRSYGAVIVKDNIIISTGYNGAPQGKSFQNWELGDTGKKYYKGESLTVNGDLDLKAVWLNIQHTVTYSLGEHTQTSSYDYGTENLAAGKPCLMCSRLIKNAMIERVVYYDRSGAIHSYAV